MYLDPVKEYNKISDWIVPLINCEVEPRLFARRLYKFLNKSHPIRIKLIDACNTTLDPDDFTIGAEYDPELDLLGKKQFIINLFINHRKRIPYLITGEFADRFTLELVETLVHEYQHQQQYRLRKYRLHKEQFISEHADLETKDDQEYLGNPDEIDAYAANIAARIFLVNQKLNTDVTEELAAAESLDLKNYFRVFGAEHPVVKSLLGKILINIKQLKDIDDGKIQPKPTGRPKLRRAR